MESSRSVVFFLLLCIVSHKIVNGSEGLPHSLGLGTEECPMDAAGSHGHNSHEDDEEDHDPDGDHGDENDGHHGDHDNMDMMQQDEYTGMEGACPATEFTFTGNNYIEMMHPTPKLKDISVCSYLTTDERGVVEGVLGSIQTNKWWKNLAVVGAKEGKDSGFRIILQGQTRKVISRLPPNAELHMCMVTNTSSNTVALYLNGRKTIDLSFSRVSGFPEGARMWIGRMEGDRYPIFEGKIRNFMLWNKMLTDGEIMKIVTQNYCPGDAKIVLLPSKVHPMIANVPLEDNPMHKYTFDNSGDKVEYLETTGTIAHTESLTVCVQIQTNARGIIPGTIASYATKDKPELLSVGGEIDNHGKAKTRFVIGGTPIFVDGQFYPNTMYKVCIVFQFHHGHLTTYVNGHFSLNSNFHAMKMLPGMGITIIGQRQRRLGSCFDRKLAYNGMLEDFMVWTRALSKEEIVSYSKGKYPTDYVISSSPQQVIPHGLFFKYQMCPSAEFNLINLGDKVTHVSAKTLPKLDYMTVCSKVVTDAKGMIPGTIGSYSTTEQPQSIVVAGQMGVNGPQLKVIVNGQTLVKDAQFMPNTKYSFCISYHLPDGHVLTFVNGQFTSNLPFNNAGSIPAGGRLIIGQNQGCPGGCFDQGSAYNGNISDFMVYDRVLSVEEMKKIAAENSCPDDQIIDLTTSDAA